MDTLTRGALNQKQAVSDHGMTMIIAQLIHVSLKRIRNAYIFLKTYIQLSTL